VADSKVHPLFPMVPAKHGPLLLHHCFPTSLLQLQADSLSREALIGDVLEQFGDLCGVVSLSRANEATGMVNISVREFGWTATMGVRSIRTMFRPEPSDSGGVMASSS